MIKTRRCVSLKSATLVLVSFALGNLVFLALKFPHQQSAGRDRSLDYGDDPDGNQHFRRADAGLHPESAGHKNPKPIPIPESPLGIRAASHHLLGSDVIAADASDEKSPFLVGNPDISDDVIPHAVAVDHQAEPGPVKVLLVSYYRGGSTIMGHWFHQNRHDAFYLYEPLIVLFRAFLADHGMTVGYVLDRELNGYADPDSTSDEVKDFQTMVIDTLNKLFNCDFEGLPGKLMSHQFMFDGKKNIPWRAKFLDCLHGEMDQDDVSACVHIPRQHCLKAEIRAIKTVRLSLELALMLRKLDPSVKFVYQIRDPRGSLHSRYHHNNWKHYDLRRDSRELCYQMSRDASTLDNVIETFRGAEKIVFDTKYRLVDTGNDVTVGNDSMAYYLYKQPVVLSRHFMYLRYEDFCVEPMKVGDILYRFVGRPMPIFTRLWMYQNTKELRDDEISLGLLHSTVAAYKWRTSLNITLQLAITEQCKGLLSRWQYSLL